MTAQEMTALIGKRGSLSVSGTRLRFAVEIRDVRQRFGDLDYLVAPLAGEGETWHAASHVKVDA
jgi:hypothetical protein